MRTYLKRFLASTFIALALAVTSTSSAEVKSGDDIGELMVKAVETRFGASLRAPCEVQ